MLVQALKNQLADPMWANHVEMSKGRLEDIIRRLEAPLDEVLFCPKCHEQHIDRPESDLEYEARLEKAQWDDGSIRDKWTNPPHHVHECQHCHHKWQHAEHNTNGVLFLQNPSKSVPRDAVVPGG